MTVTAPITQKYNLGPVKPWVSNAADLIGSKFGIKTIYGWRQSDPFPDHPSGHALDFMTPNMDTGEELKNYAVANHANLGIKYIIWNRTVYSGNNGWAGAPYTSTSNPHTDHVHITFLDQPGTWIQSPGFQPPDDPTATTTAAKVDDTCQWQVSTPTIDISVVHLSGDVCLLSKKHARFWIGAVLVLGGAALFVTGSVLLVVYGLGKTSATNVLPGMIRKLI